MAPRAAGAEVSHPGGTMITGCRDRHPERDSIPFPEVDHDRGRGLPPAGRPVVDEQLKQRVLV